MEFDKSTGKGIAIHVGGIAGAIAESNPDKESFKKLIIYEGNGVTEDAIIYPIVKNNLAIVKINNATKNAMVLLEIFQLQCNMEIHPFKELWEITSIPQITQ